MPLVALLIGFECGWLALWPLSIALSHSPAFTAALLALLPGGLGARLPSAPLSAPVGDAAYAQPVLALGALFVVIGVIYLAALLVLDRLRGGLSIVIGASLLFQATLVWLPGLFSQDVFSYVAYGRLAVQYGLNPYIWPPSAVGKDAAVSWVAEVWRSYPAPYGPIWLDVQALLARVFGDRAIAEQALAYRGLGNLLLLANLAIAWRVLGRVTPLSRSQRITALAALAWNPLVLFEISANAHNDALMVTLSLLGVATIASAPAAAAAFTLGALVKYLSAVGVGWLVLAEFARTRSAVRLVLICLVVVGVTLATAWPWLELPDSLDPLLNETAGVGYVNALPDNLALAVAGLGFIPVEVARAVERLVVTAAFAAYLLLEARQVLRVPTPPTIVRATARSLLVYILLVSTSVQPWYACLPVTLAVLLGWHDRFTRVTIGYSLLALPALYVHYYLRASTPAWVDVGYALAPVAWLTISLLRARAGADKPAAGVRHDDDRAGRHRLTSAVVEQLRR